ncbi:methyltransferase domain-containing protein [Nocardioides sp. S-58]|uniref:Methyltransferase domain-containing protein n=1 Tax=Nocardioides renjunii TaxID=3095075 RepID=A0ABU5K5U1_9ACTN|nr:methyltransferase domain-containing protein [Nocardioides sp. S-58]MDZ5660266.1 methyltransferase domain-containing protein [Nocardioides sp. S-58]
MAEYLVELYVAQGDHVAAQHHVALAEQAGADLAREGRAVRFLRSIFVPEDDTCFLLYEADSAALVTEAVGRAGLRLEHVSAATTSVAGAQESPADTTKGTSMTSTTTSSTTSGTGPDLKELRDKQQKVWSSGDYNKIAALTVPVSEHLVDHVGVGPTDRVLDVATGTGHVALAAARRSAESVGIDYVPALLDIARRRAEAEDLVVELAEADAEHLPYDDASFDVVLSAIGVMFAADHDAAGRELVRVTRPGGRIGLASWTPEGFVGGMLRTVGAHVSPPPGAQPATRWGTEEVVAGLLGDGVSDVSSVTATVRQRFTDAAEFADLFLTWYGPTYAAAGRLDDEGRAALRADLVALAESHDRGEGGGLVCDWEYRIVTATRR